MARKSPNLAIEEFSGSQFPNLRAAQRNAVSSLVPGLAGTIRSMISDGLLIVSDGKIIPNVERRE